jgi:hypothetical protein
METQLSTADWVMLCAYFSAMAGMTFLAYRKQKGMVIFIPILKVDNINSNPI